MSRVASLLFLLVVLLSLLDYTLGQNRMRSDVVKRRTTRFTEREGRLRSRQRLTHGRFSRGGRISRGGEEGEEEVEEDVEEEN